MIPKISIVTPSFNQARYVEQCILSVLDQDYPNVEHVIFDGGSKDGTLEVLRRYEDRGVRWKSELDKGQSDAINKGFRAATGDIIGWLNTDDWYARGAFRVVADYFREHPEASFVYGNNFFTDPDRRVIRRVRAMPYKWEWLLYTGLLIPQPGIFMRRRVIEECGLVDVTLRFAMDYDWWLRIAQKYPPHFVDRFLAYFRLHAASKTCGAMFKAEKWNERASMNLRYEQQVPLRITGRPGYWLAAADKRVARLKRTLLTGPRGGTLSCAPRVVVMTEGMDEGRVALFNALDEHHDLEIQLWDLSTSEDQAGADASRKMRFSHYCLGGRAGQGDSVASFNKRLWRDLWKERPDSVVVPEFSPVVVPALCYCALTRAALICWGGPTQQAGPGSGWIRNALDRRLLLRAAVCIAGSTEQRGAYVRAGVPGERVVVCASAAHSTAPGQAAEEFHRAITQAIAWPKDRPRPDRSRLSPPLRSGQRPANILAIGSHDFGAAIPTDKKFYAGVFGKMMSAGCDVVAVAVTTKPGQREPEFSLSGVHGGAPLRVLELRMPLPVDIHANWFLASFDKDYRLSKLYGQRALFANRALLQQIVRDHRIDVIHFMDNLGFGVREVKRLFGSALVTVTAMGYSKGGSLLRRLRHLYIRRSYDAADMVITRTNAMKQRLVELGVPERKIQTIHWGVSCDETVSAECCAQARRAFGVPAEAKLLLWSGHIAQIQRKSFYATLDIARELTQRRQDVFFVFAFKPYHYESSLARLESDKIRIRTDIPDFPALLAAADLFVSPVVRSDCIVPPPLTWIEAMAFGTPVMTTPVGGVNELIDHQRDGWVTDLDRFPADLNRLLDNSDLLAALSDNAVEKVRSEFNLETIARQYQDLWQANRVWNE